MDVKFIKESAYIGEALEGDDAQMLYDSIPAELEELSISFIQYLKTRELLWIYS